MSQQGGKPYSELSSYNLVFSLMTLDKLVKTILLQSHKPLLHKALGSITIATTGKKLSVGQKKLWNDKAHQKLIWPSNLIMHF